jgi:D-tyrosyl-tRNA(Tyr) deacylase
MRAVVQRVIRAEVHVDREVVGQIGPGLCVLLGAGSGDTAADVEYVVQKILDLRVFGDEHGKMNLSLRDTKGGLLIVSQFTLYGDVRKGRRPSFIAALEPVSAEALCEHAVALARRAHVGEIATGRFGAHMEVSLIGDGPVTLLVDSRRQF